MNQYEVLYAVKDDNKENKFFAGVGEAPHLWRGWTLESTTVAAYNTSDAKKSFYRYVDAFADGREYVFVKAEYRNKLITKYEHRYVAAVKIGGSYTDWLLRVQSVITDFPENLTGSLMPKIEEDLKKTYPVLTDYVLIEISPDVERVYEKEPK